MKLLLVHAETCTHARTHARSRTSTVVKSVRWLQLHATFPSFTSTSAQPLVLHALDVSFQKAQPPLATGHRAYLRLLDSPSQYTCVLGRGWEGLEALQMEAASGWTW
jgi:hypothetical protein